MTTVFVDTGAWIALMVPRDRHHQRALATFRSLPPRTRLLTSNYEVAETVTWLAYHGFRQASFKLRDMIEASEAQGLLSLVWITADRHDAGWRYYERFDDRELSFCDCASFAVCEERRVDFVFGFDVHFRVAGFDLRPEIEAR